MTMTGLTEQLRKSLLPMLSLGSWKEIEATHAALKLDWRPDLEPGWGKEKYVERVLLNLAESKLVELAGRCIETFPRSISIDVQDALWWYEARGEQKISEVTRQGIADLFDGHTIHPTTSPTVYLAGFSKLVSAGSYVDFLYEPSGKLLKVKEADFDFDAFSGLLQGKSPKRVREVSRHREMLASFGFFSWPDKRLFDLLEGLVHPGTRRGHEQEYWVERLNELLTVDGHALMESDRMSGHPIYRVRSKLRGDFGKPKNLIFSSTGSKPEIGFADAISNDVVILKHAEHCLVYDELITESGLLWSELVDWWARKEGRQSSEKRTRNALGLRLRASLTSPIEQRMFDEYYRCWRPQLGEKLPALIPQVYLHYDPLSVRALHARGEDKRFYVQRMDFLILLPQNVRVVLELDGKQHYTEQGPHGLRPSPRAYADTMAGDRQLRLAGYEVYRFGGSELAESTAERTTRDFFAALFRRHGLL
jgi:hypothetical protein